MTNNLPTDPTETIAPSRLLEALERSTRESVELRGRVELLEHTFSELEESIDERMGRLEQQMTASNAHLDNIARESGRTNELLEADLKERKQARDLKLKQEAEDKAREKQLQDDNRAMAKRAVKEFWEVFKQPLGFLVAGVIAWVVYSYFGIDKADVPTFPTTQPPAIEAPHQLEPFEE